MKKYNEGLSITSALLILALLGLLIFFIIKGMGGTEEARNPEPKAIPTPLATDNEIKVNPEIVPEVVLPIIPQPTIVPQTLPQAGFPPKK